MENRCVCCGEIIPEGRQVCPICEAKAKEPVLKPCPFCGDDAEIVSVTDSWTLRQKYFATCVCCGAETRRTFLTKKKAEEAWNRRAKDV